jgi:hypothetical protein
MRNHFVVVLLSSLGLFACGGASPAAKSEANEANPWADYKGTYGTPAPEGASEGNATKKEAKGEHEERRKSDEAPAKKASRGTVNGESLSTISVEALTDASKSVLKSKFISNSVVTGPQYELVQVQLKGATVQITRPAEKPLANGPAIASPKAKSGEVAKTAAFWFDEEADVLVVVNASGKKAAAQKALGAIVKH